MLEAWVAQNCASADGGAGSLPRPPTPAAQGRLEGVGPASVPQWAEALLLVLDVLLQERPRERTAVQPEPRQVRCAPCSPMHLGARHCRAMFTPHHRSRPYAAPSHNT